jgi:hypothetical protein
MGKGFLNVENIFSGAHKRCLLQKNYHFNFLEQYMRWTEIIRLRLSGKHYEFPIPKINFMKQGLNSKVHGLLEFRVFRNALTNGDFAIQLLWESDQPQLSGSLVGLNICQDLRKYGVVAHFVWIEDI